MGRAKDGQKPKAATRSYVFLDEKRNRPYEAEFQLIPETRHTLFDFFQQHWQQKSGPSRSDGRQKILDRTSPSKPMLLDQRQQWNGIFAMPGSRYLEVARRAQPLSMTNLHNRPVDSLPTALFQSIGTNTHLNDVNMLRSHLQHHEPPGITPRKRHLSRDHRTTTRSSRGDVDYTVSADWSGGELRVKRMKLCALSSPPRTAQDRII